MRSGAGASGVSADAAGVSVAESSIWQRGADRLARYAWFILLGAVALALVGGAIDAAMWQPGADVAQAQVDACEAPPCFGGGGLPRLRDLPAILPLLGYLLAITLGLPSLCAGVWAVFRRRWAVGGLRALTFGGPVLFFVGTEIVPHLLNPCSFALEFGGKRLPEFYCQYSLEWGADVADRWHLLDHALVGAMPMAALYWLALRKWRLSISRLR